MTVVCLCKLFHINATVDFYASCSCLDKSFGRFRLHWFGEQKCVLKRCRVTGRAKPYRKAHTFQLPGSDLGAPVWPGSRYQVQTREIGARLRAPLLPWTCRGHNGSGRKRHLPDCLICLSICLKVNIHSCVCACMRASITRHSIPQPPRPPRHVWT